MKKTIFSSSIFILFLIFVSVFFLSFFGYETAKFNEVIKSEVKKSNKNLNLDFEKISVLLDIKKLTLFVKFIKPKVEYFKTSIPLKSLRSDIDLEPLLDRRIEIKRIILATEYFDFNKVKPILIRNKVNEDRIKKIKNARFLVKSFVMEFDKTFKLKNNFKITGIVNNANIQISEEYEINNLIANYSYENNNLNLEDISWSLNDLDNSEKEFFSGKFSLQKLKESSDINLSFKTRQLSSFFKIPGINYSFSKENIASVKTNLSFNNDIIFKNISIKDPDNELTIKNLVLDKKYNLLNFGEVAIKTSINNDINNQFKIINKDIIKIEGKIFDAQMLIKELTKDKKKNKLLKNFSKDIDIEFDRILKGAKFPIKKFKLVGKIKNGDFEKISAKSDFSNNEHLDILLKRDTLPNKKILEVYSDIATPLISDYKFFQGLEGGNLSFISIFDKKNSTNSITVNNFKLNNAPALAKILTLADLKGLTDTLKGEGISFETLSIKYNSDPSTMTISEIFMIGPSISILIDGYVEKKSGLVSLRGTLVPAKTLNTIVSKIPVVGDILVGKKVGEGVFGLSFKIKGLPNNLKTTVNPVKTLAPRFITRAVEAAKKRSKQQ